MTEDAATDITKNHMQLSEGISFHIGVSKEICFLITKEMYLT